MARREDIEAFLHPQRVALIGPVDRKRSADAVLAELGRRWDDRFVLVDVEGGAVGDVEVFESLDAVDGGIDVAVLSLPQSQIGDAIEACGRNGVRYAVVAAPGLGDGAERRLVARAHELGLRLLGPNANANCFDELSPDVGGDVPRIGLVTQSGHLGRVVFQSAAHGIAFSRWIPTGNEADLDAADFIEYFAHDARTAVVAGYFEGFRDGAKLRAALAAAAETDTPVVLIKVGRHEAATRMAESHTAHLTGADDVVDGLFAQYGVVRVDDLDELIEAAALHAKLAPTPRGMRVGLYGISGGALALMAEHAEAEGVEVPLLAPETQRRLHEILPAHLGVENPVDNGNLYRTGTEAERRRIFTLIGDDSAVDVLVCALTGLLPQITDDYVSDILDYRERSGKPVVVTWNTWEMDAPAYRALVASGIPIFRSFRSCFRALAAWDLRRRRLERDRPGVVEQQPGTTGPTTRIADNDEALRLLRRYGIPLVEERVVRGVDDVRVAFEALGPRVVLKALVPAVAHKTEAGLVRTDLRSAGDAIHAFEELTATAGRLAAGAATIVLQRQLADATELIVGISRDPLLGRALLVGFGGIHAEVLRDVAVRPLPVTRADVAEMVRSLRGYPVLGGVRGGPPADLDGLVRVALAAAALGAEEAGVVELDLNPVLVGPSGAVAVDHLVVFDA